MEGVAFGLILSHRSSLLHQGFEDARLGETAVGSKFAELLLIERSRGKEVGHEILVVSTEIGINGDSGVHFAEHAEGAVMAEELVGEGGNFPDEFLGEKMDFILLGVVGGHDGVTVVDLFDEKLAHLMEGGNVVGIGASVASTLT